MPLIGVFAARGPNRRNPVGVSAGEVVEVGDTWLRGRGLDAVDGTPVLDPSPEPGPSSRLMADYHTGCARSRT